MEPIKNRTMDDHRDQWRLLTFVTWANEGPSRFEGGDTAHREGMYFAGLGFICQHEDDHKDRLRAQFREKAKLLQHPTKRGRWRRHADDKKWYGWWENMSRDQATMIVLAMSALDMHNELDEFFLHLLLRGSFMTNSRHNGVYPEGHPEYNPNVEKKWADKKPFWRRDFCGPDFWGIWFRHKMKHNAWARKVFKPVVKFIDWWDGFDARAKVEYGKRSENHADDSNFIGIRIHAMLTWPTEKERDNRRLYFHNRPFAGEPVLKEYEVTNAPMSAMRKYFDGNVWGVGASPPLDRLWQPLVDRMGD